MIYSNYTQLVSDRDVYENIAEELEHYIFPTLKESLSSDETIVRNQSLGADLISSLSSKLIKSIFPFGQKFFRLYMDESNEKIENMLIILEDTLLKQSNALNIRGVVTQVIEHLLITGNVLLDLTSDFVNFYRLDEYVVARREDGEWYQIIINKKMVILPDDDSIYSKYASSQGDTDYYSTNPFEYDFYIDIRKPLKGNIVIREFINDIEVVEKKREVSRDYPIYPIRLYEEAGDNYSHSYAFRHIGDLRFYDDLSKVVRQSALIDSKVIHLVNPASVLADNLKELASARNGDFVVGNDGDVVPYSPNHKYSIQFLIGVMEQVERRLSIAYLRGLGVIRERQTTAYEVQTLINEMSEKFGGFYITISHSLQQPIFDFMLKTLKLDKKLKDVKVEFLNGIDTLRDADKFQKLTQLVPLEAIYSSGQVGYISFEKVFKLYAQALGLNTEELIKDEQEIQAEEQYQATQAVFAQKLQQGQQQ